MGSARGASAETEDAHLRGGEAGVFLLAETLLIPSPYSGETRRIKRKPKVSAFESKSVAAPTTKRVGDGVHSLSEPPRSSARGHPTRHVSDAHRSGSQPLLWEDAEGGNRCVCPVDVASPMSLMETSGTSSIRISRRRVTLPRSRSRKRCGTSRRRSGPSILVRLLADDSPVSRDWHHELPPSS
jgi:hypothetical protein